MVDDLYVANGPEASSPAERYEAVTPSDAVNFSRVCRCIYVGGAGNVVAVRKDGTAVTFTGVLAGTFLPIRAIRVNATNTTATDMVWMD